MPMTREEISKGPFSSVLRTKYHGLRTNSIILGILTCVKIPPVLYSPKLVVSPIVKV